MARIQSHLAKRRKTLARVKLIAILLLCSLVVGALIYALTASDIIMVREVRIEGGNKMQRALASEKIATAISEESFVRSMIGADNILFWKPQEIVTSMDGLYPTIEMATIERSLWHRTVAITLHEREKKIIWCIPGMDGVRACYWVSPEGLVLEDTPELIGKAIPVIHEYSPRPIRVGETVVDPFEMENLTSAIELMHALAIPYGMIAVDDIAYKEFSIQTEAGPIIYCTFLNDPGYARKVLDSLHHSEEWASLEYINISIENKVYYK